MERHIRRSIAPEFDKPDEAMPDLDSLTPLLSPPLVFRNGKIVSRTEMRRREAQLADVRVRPKRATSG